MAEPSNIKPGIGAGRKSQPREFLLDGERQMVLWPGGIEIDGAKSRDLTNIGDTDVLLAGLLLGRITAASNYAPAIIGTLPGAYSTAGDGVSLDVGAAIATEIVRREGDSGTLTLVGPPAAAGVVAVHVETYSAVNTTTGIVTLDGAVGADLIAGSWVQTADGSEIIKGFQGKKDGKQVTDIDRLSIVTDLNRFVVGGIVDTSQIINVATDPSLLAFLKARLRDFGTYWFDDDFD